MKFGRRGFLKGLGSLVGGLALRTNTLDIPVDKEPDISLDTAVVKDLYPAIGNCSSFVGPSLYPRPGARSAIDRGPVYRLTGTGLKVLNDTTVFDQVPCDSSCKHWDSERCDCSKDGPCVRDLWFEET